MNKEILLIKESEKPLLRRLLELYAYDFSEYDGADLNEFGEYGYHRLDHYWTDDDRYPYIFRVDGNISGFAMIRIDEDGFFSVAEFFILKKYRRKGLGKFLAEAVFNKHHGSWHVGVLNCNGPAQIFWKKTIAEYTDGKFEIIEKAGWDGPVFEFGN